MRYVAALCLAGTRLDAETREASARWDVDFETGEGLNEVPQDQLAEFAADALVGPLESLRAALEQIAAPPAAEEFHSALVRHRIERSEALAAALDRFPSQGGHERLSASQAYSRLLAEVGTTFVTVPAASVELRSRLFAAASKTPECDDTEFLTALLGGGNPTREPSEDDERYLKALCSAGAVFEVSLVGILPELNNPANDKTWQRVLSDDIAAFHLEYVELLREGIDFFASLGEGNATDTAGLTELARYQRLLGPEGEPTPPPAVRTRLLESANNIEECGGIGFLHLFLGTDEE